MFYGDYTWFLIELIIKLNEVDETNHWSCHASWVEVAHPNTVVS